jgi:hypothetical protein
MKRASSESKEDNGQSALNKSVKTLQKDIFGKRARL